MKQKINYNRKNNKNNKLKITLIVIFSLFVLFILIKSVKKAINLTIDSVQNDKLEFRYYVNEYNSLNELLVSCNCEYIRDEQSKDLDKIYVNFKFDLYSGNVSNEEYFWNISRMVAEFLKFKDFELIDENKNIDIEVKCQAPNIIEFKINDDVNYYLNHNSEINKKLSSNITNFTIQSKQLQELIDGQWDESKVEWGTRDSICDGYNIYFEEGIKYRNVDRKVFNVIFTQKYREPIAGDLTVDSSCEAVKNALGEPTFSDGDVEYGYLGKNNYLFFDFINKEVSVYPVINISEDDEEILRNIIEEMNSSNDIKAFASSLTDLWNDYDVYDYDLEYVDLKYTLKGFELFISIDSLKNGIYLYQNYSGNRNLSALENVYVKEFDMVFEAEKNRTLEENVNRVIQGLFSEEQLFEMGKEFSLVYKSVENGKNIGPRFYSRNFEYADSELDRNLEVSSSAWYDEYKLIYSVDNDGIYVYNCRTRVNKKIIDIDGEITINSIEEEKIIYNDQILNVIID